MASGLVGSLIPVDMPLMSAGFDSISATEFSNKLSDVLHTELSSTLLFDHPSLRSVALSLDS